AAGTEVSTGFCGLEATTVLVLPAVCGPGAVCAISEGAKTSTNAKANSEPYLGVILVLLLLLSGDPPHVSSESLLLRKSITSALGNKCPCFHQMCGTPLLQPPGWRRPPASPSI